MVENSKIEWTDHTHNFWIGCTRVSAACDFCYAETFGHRFGIEWGAGEARRLTSVANARKPLVWNHRAAKLGIRYKVFTNSLSDFGDAEVPDEWRDKACELIEATPNLDWLVLTKRPNVMLNYWERRGGVPSNVWQGVTVENQDMADIRIPLLLKIPARVRFLSCEPLLGPLDIAWALSRNRLNIAAGFLERGQFSPGLETLRALDLVICGGESGPHARPMHPDWPRSLRNQCKASGAAFHFKQHGEWIGVPDLRRSLPGGQGPGFGAFDHCEYDMDAEAVRVGKAKAGRLLDGREWNEMPA